jgi:hypothetical protein
VVFVLSLVIMSTFVAWEYYVMKRTTLPPLVHLRLFQRHGHRVTYVLLTALTAYTAINVGDQPVHTAIMRLSADFGITGMGILYDYIVSKPERPVVDAERAICPAGSDSGHIRLRHRPTSGETGQGAISLVLRRVYDRVSDIRIESIERK